MFISSRGIVAALILIVAVATGSASEASIVVNGDFENAVPFTGWTLTVDAGSGGGPYGGAFGFNGFLFWDNGSTSVLGTSGDVAYVEVYQLGVTAESLTQPVSLEGGVKYQVTYEENARQIASAGLQPLVEVFLGGTSVVAQHSVSQVNAQFDSTNLFHAITSSTFTAPTTGSFTLDFKVSEPAGDNSIMDLTALFDNVSITALPEPASFALLGIGSIAMMSVRRRRGRSL